MLQSLLLTSHTLWDEATTITQSVTSKSRIPATTGCSSRLTQIDELQEPPTGVSSGRQLRPTCKRNVSGREESCALQMFI